MQTAFVRLTLKEERPVEYEVKITAPETVAELVRKLTKDDATERAFLFALDAKNRITAIFTLSDGQEASCEISQRIIFKAALVSNAQAVVLAHNHPSGDPTPSQADRAITKMIKERAVWLGINFLDHVVVTQTKCNSCIVDL